MASGDRYSQIVQISKIVLPLVALCILATFFLFSGDIDPESAIPYAEVDVEEIAREQRLTNPRFATMGEDGATIELSAQEARPNVDEPERIDATGISGTIGLPGGAVYSMTSGAAIVDMSLQIAGLTEGVLIESNQGYEMSTDRLITRLDRAELSSEGAINVQTPFGELQAGNMLLRQEDATYRLVFNNKVKLLYVPGVKEE